MHTNRQKHKFQQVDGLYALEDTIDAIAVDVNDFVCHTF
jgi:hypothetical protein